jgi:hypothetical protein
MVGCAVPDDRQPEDEYSRDLGRVVVEHEAAKQRLTELQIEANVLAEYCFGVGHALKNGILWELDEGGRFSFHDEGGVGGTFRITRWPSYETVQALLEDIQAARQRVAALEKRRTDLGG